jgi:hypothetical protein
MMREFWEEAIGSSTNASCKVGKMRDLTPEARLVIGKIAMVIYGSPVVCDATPAKVSM